MPETYDEGPVADDDRSGDHRPGGRGCLAGKFNALLVVARDRGLIALD